MSYRVIFVYKHGSQRFLKPKSNSCCNITELALTNDISCIVDFESVDDAFLAAQIKVNEIYGGYDVKIVNLDTNVDFDITSLVYSNRKVLRRIGRYKRDHDSVIRNLFRTKPKYIFFLKFHYSYQYIIPEEFKDNPTINFDNWFNGFVTCNDDEEVVLFKLSYYDFQEILYI